MAVNVVSRGLCRLYSRLVLDGVGVDRVTIGEHDTRPDVEGHGVRGRRPALNDVRKEGRVGDAETRGVDVREDGEPAGIERCLGVERVVEFVFRSMP